MAYRNDKDALLVRAEALDRENERLEAELEAATGERDDLRGTVRANDRELAKLRKQLAKHDQPASRGGRNFALVGAVFGLIMVGGVVAVLGLRAPSDAQPTDNTPAVAPTQAVDMPVMGSKATPKVADTIQRTALDDVYDVRGCLDVVDFTLRNILLMDDVNVRRLAWSFDGRDNAAADTCAELLVDIEQDDAALPEMTNLIKAYRDTLAVLRPVVIELRRYYEEEDFADDQYAGATSLLATMRRDGAAFIAASDALRAAYLPVFTRLRDEQVAHIVTSSPKREPLLRLAALATDLMDAIFATNPSVQRIDELMAAIATLRADNADLDFDYAVTFHKFAKRIHRGLGDLGAAATLTAGDIHELRMLISYYRMAGFGGKGPPSEL